ncbi:MAG TPA: IPT/TIG domain-containing protein, partial [Bryobacteraceae bacterium]
TIASDLAITSVSPTSVQAGSPGVQLTITGKGFVSGSVVNFNATKLTPVFVSASSLTADVPGGLLATGGTALITVSNPDGSVANGPTFVITSQPFITAPVVNGASFLPGIQSGSWSTVFGTNLSTTTRNWDGAIIDGKLPLSLDNVSVMVNNKPAAIYFISPGQINFQAPDDTATGAVNVTVTNSSGTSNSMVAQLQRDAPGFFMFDPQARKYVAALVANADGSATFLGPPNLFGAGGAVTRPAKPGEILELYGTGFGPTNPAVKAGFIVGSAAPAVDKVTITIGGLDAVVQFAGITGAGLYQINAVVPLNLAAGDQPIVATVNNSLKTPDGSFVTITTK